MRRTTEILVLIEELESKVLSTSKEEFKIKDEVLEVLRELRKKVIKNEWDKIKKEELER